MFHFAGIGAQKAGTTWLYHMLKKHPHLNFPAGKEIHFWDAQYDKGVEYYKGLFSDQEKHIEGEITPRYAILEPDRIRECYRHFPEIRLIYILRNPIERAWSAALMALARSEMKLDEASDRWFMDHFTSSRSIAHGNYRQCLQTWTAVFPAEQLLVLRYDMLATQPRRLLTKVCGHIGVEHEPVTGLDNDVFAKRISPVRGIPAASIRQSLLPFLREIYYPRIESLGELLGQDFSDWLI